MKEIPILFSTPMVQALLAGTKTQTRRLVKGSLKNWLNEETISPSLASDPSKSYLCPYGTVGDRLWVREKFAARDCHQATGSELNQAPWVFFEYAAEPGYKSKFQLSKSIRIISTPLGEQKKWMPSIHMPKAAAKRWLEIVSIRVERLQAISDVDARAEGIPYAVNAPASYKLIWEEINGADSWQQNPWVWVVEFKVSSTTGRPE